MEKEETDRPRMVRVPLAMPEALDAKVKEASEETGLSKQDTMRLGLERGLPILVAQLKAKLASA